jgi:uncharacterized membrane protein YhaH (DUF805 family)
MGYSAWLLLVPAILWVVTFANRVHIITLGDPLNTVVPLATLAVSAVLIAWCCIGRQAEANRFGTPAAA